MSPEKQKVFDRLWANMSAQGDFPTLTHSINHIVSAVRSRSDHLEKIVAAVISDFSLTQKVLRLANSAMYAAFGRNVTTVSRAILVLGQEMVGHLALGLRLLDTFKGMRTDRDKAKHVLAEVMLSGLVARRLTESIGVKEGEEAVVCALLSRLGELVCVFYAPDQWSAIEERMQEDGISADRAAERVLGLTISEIGQEVARRWALPPRLREALQPFEPRPVDEPLSHVEWLRAMSAFSHELARAIATGNPEDTRETTGRYAPLLALDPQATQGTLETLVAEAQTDGGWEGLADIYFEKADAEHSGKPVDSERRLAAGVAEIERSARECQTPVLLQMALEVMQKSLGCARVIAFVLEPATGRYSARVGFGQPRAGEITQLSFESGFAPDVFHFTLSAKSSVHIADTHDQKIRLRIPAWHRTALCDARSMILIPVVAHGQALALLYADWTCDNATALSEKETHLLKAIVLEIERAIRAEPCMT